MLSHPLLAQSLPVVAVKAAPTADATGFDQLIKSEKTTFNLIGQTEQAKTVESEADLTSEDGDLPLVEVLDEALDGAAYDLAPDADAVPAQSNAVKPELTPQATRASDLPQSLPDTDQLTTQSANTTDLPEADSLATDLTVQTTDRINFDPSTDEDRSVTLTPTDQVLEPEAPAKNQTALREAAAEPDTAEIAPSQPLAETAKAVDGDFESNSDGTEPQAKPVLVSPETPEDLEDKTSQEEAPLEVALADVPMPVTTSLAAPNTPDQTSFQAMVVEASAEPVAAVTGGEDSVETPEITPKFDRDAPKDLSFTPLPNQTEPVRAAQVDAASRQDAKPVTAPTATANPAAGIVDVNMQTTQEPETPRSFASAFPKPLADVQESAPSASPKTAEIQPLADTPNNAQIQPLRPTLTPIPAAAEAQQPAAPQPSKSPIVRQVMDQLVQYPTETGTATIRLKPHGMGVIEITVERTKEGNLTVDMRVQNPLVLEAMRNERGAISHLFQPTATSGGGTLSMDLFQSGAGRNGQDQHGQPAKDTPTGTAENPSQDQPDTPVAAQNQQSRASGGLNILT